MSECDWLGRKGVFVAAPTPAIQALELCVLLAWIVNTFASAVLGFVVGSLIVGVLALVSRVRGKKAVGTEH